MFIVVVTAVDEQNAQTSASTSSLAEAIVTVAATAAGEVVTTSTARIEEEVEPVQGTVEPVYNSPVYSGHPVYNSHWTTSQKCSLIFTVNYI